MRPEMPNIHVSRRGKLFIGVLASLVVLVLVLQSVAQVYARWLWFGELGYHRVYSTIFVTRTVLFLAVGLFITVVIGANIALAYRMRPPFRPISQEQENLERYRIAVEPRKKLAFLSLLALVFLIAGSSGQGNWRIWQLWLNGTSFGITDPQFHRDISFFAWDYPFYRLILSLGFSAVIFSLLFSIGVHYLFGALRIVTPGPKLTISARRHLTVLVFFFIVLKACAYWLDRYGLVFSERYNVTGASYTDVHASLPAKTILFWVAVLIALTVLASLWLHSAPIAGISFVVLLILSIGIAGIYPALVQQVSVKPNASDKEKPYIARSIEATRQAYDVVTSSTSTGQGAGTATTTNGSSSTGLVTYSDYGAATAQPAAQVPNDTSTVPNIRITDPSVISPTFTNAQQLRNYYGFADKLDIDRYTTNGVTSDYIVGARELKAANLSGNQTNWINKHTVYTHGYGFVAAKASQDVAGKQDFAVGDIPMTGFLKVTQPRIYYGELGVDYSIVGATGARENDASDAHSSYDGSGGIKLNLLNRLTFAIKYGETNFILNDAVSAKGAKIMFDRDPRQRVLQAAPFLKVDGDPYPAVINGRIVWILDGYTTIANYPYSQRQSLGSATTDTFSSTNKTAAQPNDQINYIRNSVKATVDAYDGTVKLYAWDESDPVLQTWRKVFPGVIQPKSAILDSEVASHLRYPQDLFEVQRAILERYHVSDPVQFYNVTDQWTVPNDPADTAAQQPPYYVLAGANAGAGVPQYQLTTPMKVNSRPNMAAYISVNSEAGPNYGKISVLRLPAGSSIQGPEQIAQRFQSDPVISSDISLLNQGGSTVIHGNLLSLPLGNSFLYVEPLYVQATGANAFPLLTRVLVSYGGGGHPGYGSTLSSALRNLSQPNVGQEVNRSGSGTTTTTPSSSAAPSGSASPGVASSPSTSTDVDAILGQLDTAYTDLQTATQSGDFARAGAAYARIGQLAQEYNRARGVTTTPATSSKPSAKATATPKPS